MGFNELRYHLRRMWGKFGFNELIVNDSGINLFKFKENEGMQNVLAKGPWMVNNRPLFVLKWSHEIGMKKIEPSKLPVWVKLLNVPMEAWSLKGITSLASSLGRPLMMDEMTARMCQNGVGRTDYARVMVEFEACKVMKNEIKNEYNDKERNVKGTKMVNVMYDWKPESCDHCKVFGHSVGKCVVRPRTVEEIKAKTDEEARIKAMNEASTANAKEVKQDKNGNWQQQRNGGQNRWNNQRQMYREKNFNVESVEKRATKVDSGNNAEKNDHRKRKEQVSGSQTISKGHTETRISSNQFEALT